ncbi:hypothetical protein DDB_G0287577 [Dictyostelium discoideum AX4]|uniref:Alpha-mannosidase G n=1 Tax=Dictyostelium discoideum TaxID=44689 RepID=MANG_DICDI|nr:hypothetical protein DDB_G0287577 [Dictyostelium discoideum AX4]Q54K67.1 RecName: Full=Alpha-mannosidase G [Dictyostelium discoideum]EAL63688.1 hypothetical protein DDB_G0287577 [Dictyostelium discoideum AX4]|eukprot:XP_637188.1 hypothetical protein DDB_G0287577 [Dictyostelium discoideum AX4]
MTSGNVMLKHQDVTIERIEKFLSDTYFVRENLYGKLISLKSSEAVKVKVSPKVEGISYKDAIQLEYKDTKIGESFGPSWTNYWFKVTIDVPTDWKDKTIHFIWNSSCEGLIWMNGIAIQGLIGGTWQDLREEYKLIENSKGGEHFEFYIEISCNGMFGVGKDGLINPCDPDRTFELTKAEIRVKNKEANELYMYLQMLYDVGKNFPKESLRKKQAIWVANDIINQCNVNDSRTFSKCIELAKKEFFSQHNSESQTRVWAVGHCHIDLCWLWSFEKTKEKCARSFSTQILYMDYYPQFKFTQSQAQAYQWTKENYPELYERIKEKVVTGQFIPTGGTWVEMDGNLPSGESFIRQFLYGQRFFEKEFGKKCTEFFLPDTFGYSAQLPQVIRHMGIENFITQKLSWNNLNKFPHSTFIWEGIDGSSVLTHFPPADTYNSQADVKEIVMSSSNNKDIDRCNESMLLYGNGDGGGGPTIPMIERLTILKDTAGIPKIEFSTPAQFFKQLEPHRSKLNKWVGELYFELHRGTYTSQATTKRGNRLCEIELHATEMLTSYCELFVEGFKSPNLSKLWQQVLLCQFHDALPGSSIQVCYEDILKIHQQVLVECKNIITQSMNHITGTLLKIDNLPTTSTTTSTTTTSTTECTKNSEFVLAFNANDFEISRVIEIPKSNKDIQAQYINAIQTSYNGLPLGTVSLPPNGFSAINISTSGDNRTINRKPGYPCTAIEKNDASGDILIDNQFISIVIGSNGRIKSLIEKSANREVIKQDGSLGNRLIIFDDTCLFWDAWDQEIFSLEKPLSILEGTCKIIENGPLRCVVQVHYDSKGLPSGNGSVNQTIIVHFNSARVDFETNVNWNEAHKLLRVDFDTNIRAKNANYEIQFGHIERPTHYNTSWDFARFEVVGHKWADLSEYDFGMALLNDCKYGYSTLGGRIGLSLLRSPKSPDDTCDMGSHKFTYSIYPHRGSLQSASVIKEGYSLNNNFYISETPFSLASTTHIDKTFISTNKEAIIVDTIKKAEDGTSFVVRVYESFGGATTFNFTSSILPIPFKSIIECNGLEEVNQSSKSYKFNDTIKINPFEIKTFRFISN